MNRFDPSRQVLAISLAGLAGYVDAVGFLSADGYFVSFMSGNTTRLAVDLATAPARAVIPALLLGGFVTGVAGGAWLALRAGRWRKPAVAGMVTLLLLTGAILRADDHIAGSLAMLVMAMGALNNTFQRDGEVAVGLTYMTGALVRLGQGIGAVLARQARPGWSLFGLLWLGLAIGALAGALMFTQIGGAALWIAASLAALLTLAAWRIARRDYQSS